MNIKELAEQAIKAGSVPDPDVIKVEVQVRTGMMFPLPDWIDSPGEPSGSPRDEKPDQTASHRMKEDRE